VANPLSNHKKTVMKQVININFQGQVVPIEVTAFELLKNQKLKYVNFIIKKNLNHLTK
jgi:uncharacterized membrane protein